MSVLRKKIDKALVATPLDQEEVALCWDTEQQLILASLETLIETLFWDVQSISVSHVKSTELENTFEEKGLFATFGMTDRETLSLLSIDPKLAALVTRFGFEGQLETLEGLETHEVSKFDLLLLDSLISQITHFIAPSSESIRKDYISAANVPFASDYQNWVKLDLSYTVSLTTKSEPLPLSLTLLMTQEKFDEKIKKGPQIDIVSETLDFDETAESLTRHVDKSLTPLRAVLESCEMTVADCTRLSIGQIIPLPGVSLQELRVEAELKDTRVCVAKAALGIHKMRRAVQLVEDIDPEFIDQGHFAPA